MAEQMISCEGKLRSETDKAICVRFDFHSTGVMPFTDVWLPKKLIEIERFQETVRLIVPEWLAREKRILR